MNNEERDVPENACLDYQDIFYLPGDKLHESGEAFDNSGTWNGTNQH